MNDSQPSTRVKLSRQPCPFYGFSKSDRMSTFVDRKNNRCPLREGYAPCIFEGTGQKATWARCPINRESNNLLEQLGEYTVFSEEVDPEGISFKEWARYIL